MTAYIFRRCLYAVPILVGVAPIDLQRRLTLPLFNRLLSSRAASRIVTPRSLLRAVDDWAGPFMFRSAASEWKQLDDTRFRLELTLLDGMASCSAFFEHCAAGMQAAFETVFGGCSVTAVNIGNRIRYIATGVLPEHEAAPGSRDVGQISSIHDPTRVE